MTREDEPYPIENYATPAPVFKPGELWKQLTIREREVAEMIALGHKNDEIAAALGAKVKTIGSHRAAAMKKLGVRNNVELARIAIREGAVPVP